MDSKILIEQEIASTGMKIDHVANLGPGSSFGEMSLILSKPRMSSVTCLK